MFDLDTNWERRFDAGHVFFRASEFVEEIRKKHPIGTVFVWDEVGVENDSRSWYSLKNKMIKYVMETYRDKNYVVLVTAPTLKSIDIATQRLLTGYLEMKGKIGDGSMAIGKFEHVQVNPKSGKAYFKQARYWAEGKFYRGEKVVFPRPPEGLELAYKLKKKEYQRNLYKNISNEIEFMSEVLSRAGIAPKREETYSLNDIVKIALDAPQKFLKDGKRFSSILIESELGISERLSVRAARLLNMKYARNLSPQPSYVDTGQVAST
ncbi:hypothetical protein DRN67_02875 [Candidatus Micrarchaeota archaeon]|nr:MAG: hypothetical protein DRN67_02875 [Candidatus Micrarchaeota archaeon]